MSSRIEGRRALITGASAGIGEACARRLARDGVDLVLWARRADRLDRLAGEIEQSSGVSVRTGLVDVRDDAAVFAEAERLAGEGLSPDILINNAGLAAGLAAVHEGEVDDWNRMIDTNIKGLLFVTRAFMPSMLARGRGHIVNIGSIAGRQVYPNGNVYCGTKYAVQAISEGTNLEVLGTGVRVSVVNPGLVETEFSVVRFDGDEARAKTVYEGVNALSAADVADVVAFVLGAPPHVNIADVVVLPADQGSVHHVHREGG